MQILSVQKWWKNERKSGALWSPMKPYEALWKPYGSPTKPYEALWKPYGALWKPYEALWSLMSPTKHHVSHPLRSAVVLWEPYEALWSPMEALRSPMKPYASLRSTMIGSMWWVHCTKLHWTPHSQPLTVHAWTQTGCGGLRVAVSINLSNSFGDQNFLNKNETNVPSRYLALLVLGSF